MPQRVDPAWAKEVLEWWVAHADAALMDGRGRREFQFCTSGPKTDALLEREVQTRRVIKVVLGLDTVEALVRPFGQHNFVELQSGLDLARRALGHLATGAETARHTTGTSAPTMAADSLHPLVWDAASKLWHDGHHGPAVQRAATFLNAHVQDLTGRRDVSDSALMGQAFSASPPEISKPRLRWPGDDTDLTVKAMRSGLLQFSQGCFMAIRNPATHSTSDTSVQEALEQLAILSTLARWIDRCELREAETPEP
ncbi:MAG TPA: TIGR02391 family protein [Jatrophihabitans sp.]|nr:TIGR02391 family protein [Jatrophihabitans sp.]